MNKKRYLIIGLISLFSLFPLFVKFPYLLNLSLGLDDLSSRFFYYLNKKNIDTSPIVLIAIDDYSLERIGQRWPLRRSVYAQALSLLNEEKAKVVGFDLILEGDSPIAEDDTAFASALKDFNGKVALAYLWDKGVFHWPKAEFKQYALTGFVNSTKDADGVMRRSAGYISFDDFSDASFNLKLASAYQGEPEGFVQGLVKKLHLAPKLSQKGIKEQYELNINYLAKPQAITTVRLFDLLNKNFPKDLFKNKIVIIGTTLRAGQDIHETPLGPPSMPGVVININVILDILEGRLTRMVPFVVTFIAVLLIIIISAYILSSFTFLRGIMVYLSIPLGLFWLSVILKFSGWYIPLGRILVCSFIFVVLASFYHYAIYLAFLIQVKNKLTRDPLTNLLNIRYFSERLALDSRGVFRRKKCLVVAFLDGYKAYAKAQSLQELKDTWARISLSLFPLSSLWARYKDDVVVGFLKKYPDFTEIKNMLSSALREKGIKVKAAYADINADIDVLKVCEFLVSEINKGAADVVTVKPQLPKEVYHRVKHAGQLYSLSLDAEEKNAELLSLIEQLKNEEQKAKEAYFEMISSLVTALESKDAYTKGHTQRVCNYSLMLAEKLDLSLEERERIRKAALLHDLGKIGIPDSVLQKKGQLNDEEFTIIKEHEILSAKILEPVKEFKDIIPYVLYHHENFDGSGYPHGLAADFIPLGARIIAAADMFDALTTGRSYKIAFSVEETVREMEKSKGKKLDPALTDKFIEALREFHILTST